MKHLKIVIAIFLLYSSILQSQSGHNFEFSAIGYAEQINSVTQDSNSERVQNIGAGLQMKHSVADIPVFGTRAQLTLNYKGEITLEFSAFVLRFTVFKDFMTIEVVSPSFAYTINRAYEFKRPFGAGVEIGRKKLKVYITQMIGLDNTFETRLSLKYIF